MNFLDMTQRTGSSIVPLSFLGLRGSSFKNKRFISACVINHDDDDDDDDDLALGVLHQTNKQTSKPGLPPDSDSFIVCSPVLMVRWGKPCFLTTQ
jgi:hypothetical protein